MRCNNCGYVNEDSAQRCIKCNADLTGSAAGYAQGTRSETFQPGATVSETGGGLHNADASNRETSMHGASGGSAQRRRPEPSGGALHPTPPVLPVGNRPVGSGTMPPGERPAAWKGTFNPWAKRQPQVQCYLTSLDGETNTPSGQPIAFSGGSCEITRDGINPADRAISAHQAMLTHDGQGWYIEDQSTYQTTAIVAKRRLKLEEGDIIVLGTSRYIFSENQYGEQ